ncbi:MAG: hypothetical protein ABI772_01175 [Bacteroidota bacterium]
MLKDKFIYGFLPGLLLPVIGSFIYYLIFFNLMGLKQFINHIIFNNLFIGVLSIGVILNLGLFFIYYQLEKDRSAQGVIGATFIYAFVVMYFKVIK